MATSKKEVFTFTWRIVNFSFCPLPTGKKIESAIFSVDFLKSEWRLLLYPRGYNQRCENYVGVFLRRESRNSETTGFSLMQYAVTGKKTKHTVKSHNFNNDKIWGFSKFLSRKDIFNNANSYLPNDTLTIKCKLWKAVDVGDYRFVDNDLFSQMPPSVKRDCTLNLKTKFGFNQSTAITRIEVKKISIIWPILRFSELCPKQQLSLCVPMLMNSALSFSLILYINGGKTAKQNAHIEIRADFNGRKEHYFVKCKMVAFNVMIGERCEKEDEHLFDSDAEKDVWKFPKFIDIKKFKKDSCFNLSQDTLYLRCEFAFTTPSYMCHVEKSDSVPFWSEILLSNFNNSIGPMFKHLCQKDKFSDVIIRTGNHKFKVHKIVLSQSAVFSAMFETDMAEKQSGTVVIKDIEKRILDLMLRFLYGEDLKIPSVEDAEKLYFAADKYQILPLKWLCSCFLKSNLSVSNICSVLSLADLHLDEDLMDEVKRFILSHAEIFHFPAWTKFMKSNCQLAGDVMLNVLKNLNL